MEQKDETEEKQWKYFIYYHLNCSESYLCSYFAFIGGRIKMFFHFLTGSFIIPSFFIFRSNCSVLKPLWKLTVSKTTPFGTKQSKYTEWKSKDSLGNCSCFAKKSSIFEISEKKLLFQTKSLFNYFELIVSSD